MDLRKAMRKQGKIKLAMQGSSGSGKPMSALLLAAGLTEYSKIAVIDTENHSADLYAPYWCGFAIRTSAFGLKYSGLLTGTPITDRRQQGRENVSL